MYKPFKFIFALFFLIFTVNQQAFAASIIADLSTNRLILDYDFKGQYITISGIADEVDDIILKVEGPQRPFRVWKKEKIYGVWLNTKSFTVRDSVSFYFLATTNNITKIAPKELLNNLKIGLGKEKFQVEEKYNEKELIEFKEEIKRIRQKQRLFPQEIAKIDKINTNLFRSKFYIPEYSYTGTYIISIYGFKDKKLVAQTDLRVEAIKRGLYARIDLISHSNPLRYAFYAIIIALVSGLVISYLFKRDK